MAKNLFLITVGLVLGLAIGSSELAKMMRSANSDFRAAHWGMTPEEVKRSESSMQPSEETNSFLSYEQVTTSLYGKTYRATINYYFVDSRLAGGCYDFNPTEPIPLSEPQIEFYALDAGLKTALGPKTSERLRGAGHTVWGEEYDFLST